MGLPETYPEDAQSLSLSRLVSVDVLNEELKRTDDFPSVLCTKIHAN